MVNGIKTGYFKKTESTITITINNLIELYFLKNKIKKTIEENTYTNSPLLLSRHIPNDEKNKIIKFVFYFPISFNTL